MLLPARWPLLSCRWYPSRGPAISAGPVLKALLRLPSSHHG
jgi:hypothetical protein